MGMTAFEVFGVLKLDTEQYNSDLKSAVQSGTVAGNLISDGIRIGAQAMVKAGQTAIQFGQNAISAATSYESAFTGVRKTVDATEEEYNALSDWIMDASTKMASSKEEIAATMEIAGQLGVSGVEGLEKFTETMIMLGDTTNLNAEEAASALAKFGNIAGVGAEDMDKIGSVIVDLGNHFATTEADIVNMATRLASAGTIAGLSSTDILALSTAMSSVGIQAEAGGTAMSQTLANMSKAVDMGVGLIGKDLSTLDKDQTKAITNLESFANVAGMSAQEFADAWKGDPMTAVSAFINGLHNINEADESVIMTLEDLGLKGIRQTNMLQSLALASDMMGNAVDTANTAFEENTALMDEANKRYGTTESQAMQTAEAFKNLKVQIGDELLPVYSDLMSFSSEAMKSMSEGLQSGGIEGLVESFGTGLSDALNMFTQKLPDIVNIAVSLLDTLGQGIVDNLPTIITAFTSIVDILTQNMSKSLPVLIPAVLQILMGLANAMISNAPTILQAVIDSIVQWWNGLSSLLPTLIPTIVSLVVTLANMLVANVGIIIEAAITLIRALADGIIQALPILIEAIPSLLEAVLKTILENIAVIITAGIEILLALATGIIDAIPQLIDVLPEIIFAIVQALLQATPQILESGIELMIALGKGLIQAIPQILSLIPRIIWEIALTLKKESPRLLESGFDLVMKIGDGIKEKISEAMTWGKDLIDNFIEGIKAKIENIKKVAAYVGKSIKDFLGFSEPEKGPLSDFHTYAPDMMNLFAKGIKDNENVITGQIEKSFNFGQIPQMEVAGAGGMAYNYSDNASNDYGDIITAITDSLMNMQLVVNIGNRPIEAMITSAQQKTTYRSGGR